MKSWNEVRESVKQGFRDDAGNCGGFLIEKEFERSEMRFLVLTFTLIGWIGEMMIVAAKAVGRALKWLLVRWDKLLVFSAAVSIT